MPILVDLCDSVASVVIDREHRRNALDNEALEALIAAFEGFRRQEVTAVVISGKGTQGLFRRFRPEGRGGVFRARDPAPHLSAAESLAKPSTNAPSRPSPPSRDSAWAADWKARARLRPTPGERQSQFGFPEDHVPRPPHRRGDGEAAAHGGPGRAREMLLFANRLDAREGAGVGPGRATCRARVRPSPRLRRWHGLCGEGEALLHRHAEEHPGNGYGTSARVGHTMAYLADCALSQTESSKAASARPPTRAGRGEGARLDPARTIRWQLTVT